MASNMATPADVLLSDGTVAVIRPVTADDHAELLALHLRASDRSRWLRFFTAGTTASRTYVAHLRTSTTTIALVAEVSGTLVGLGTAEAVNPDVEEVAFLVDDAWQGRGVASQLLEHLAADARSRGVSQLTATVLTENHRMMAVFLDAGFTTTRRSSGGVLTVTLDSGATTDYIVATTAREAYSEHASLAPLLAPRSIAMMGVRRDGTGLGASVLRSVRAAGYGGSLCAIHPSGEQVAGLLTYRTLRELDTPPDLAIVTVTGQAALAAVTEAATAGVGAAVVLSSGFGEAGRRGATLQQRMLRVAREHSMRLVGPNSLGMVLNGPALRLSATSLRFVPPPGGLAVATQSGGAGIVLMDSARRRALGVQYFVSLGNVADVSSSDLLSVWRDDPEVTVGALHLESFGNAGTFARLAHSFSERKPLLAVVGGRSARGVGAGGSHTAAALTDVVEAQALFTQAGVVECRSADELTETAAVFAEQPRAQGRRLGILTNAGGLGVLAADAADRCGLAVPTLPRTARARLSRLLQGTTGTSNPVDVGAAVDASRVARAAEVLLGSPVVDALLLVLVGTDASDPEVTLREVSRVRLGHPAKPVLVVPLGGVEVPPDVRSSRDRPGLTELPSVEAAANALAQVNRYQDWCRLPPATAPPHSDGRVRTARDDAQRLLSTRGEGWLDPQEASSLVRPYGVPTVGTVEVPPVRHGVELTMGIVRHETVGPLVMVATVGASTDVLPDRRFLMPPFDGAVATHVLQSLRTTSLLRGHQTGPPVGGSALSDLVVSLGQLALEVPEVAEVDLNPVVAHAHGVDVVDVRLRIATPSARDDGLVRDLRPRR